jgi:hypothetical protein
MTIGKQAQGIISVIDSLEELSDVCLLRSRTSSSDTRSSNQIDIS